MPPTRKTTTTPLQRGLACLSCRKRKLKCDGLRPVCTPCTKMKREEECEYEDKKHKSRTQKLKEKLAMLEERIRELEGPEEGSFGGASASPPGYDPPIQSQGALAPVDLDSVDLSALIKAGSSRPVSVTGWPITSSSSSATSSDGSLGQLSRSISASPFTAGMDNTDLDLLGLNPLDFTGLPVAFDFNDPNFMNACLTDTTNCNWNTKLPLPEANKKILLDIFYAHRHQCWFDGDFSRFDPDRASPSYQPYTEPHPALMNSVFLLACHFTRSPLCAELENTFHTRTLHEITVALDNSDRLVDVVQASCLLAVYLFANSRILEGYCQSFSAARLAVGLGLHQLQQSNNFPVQGATSTDSSSTNSNTIPGLITGLGPSGSSPIPLAPPVNSTELRDRISTFWQVFMVDRCWSVANGLPVALPDGEHHQGRIKTPWPEPQEDPQNIVPGVPGNNNFTGVFLPALKAKAAALYERTFRLASASNKTEAYWTEQTATLLALQRFSNALPFFVGYEAWRAEAPFLDVELFTVHTLVNVCNIHLHGGIVQPTDLDFNNASIPLQAANYIMTLIRQLSHGDYEFLDPLLTACWLSVAKFYIQLLNAVNTGAVTSLPAYAVDGELDVIVTALKSLSVYVPLAGEHAQKIEQERGYNANT